MRTPNRNEATHPLRIDRAQLARLHEIAAAEHRSLAQWFRVVIERKIAQHEGRPS